MRVMIADAESRVRRALRVVLERQPELDVVGEARSGDELMQAVSERQVDLLVLDWGLLGDGVSEVLKGLREQLPALRVIAVSGKRAARTQALAAGADEFVCKGDSGQRLLEAIAECYELSTESGQGASQ